MKLEQKAMLASLIDRLARRRGIHGPHTINALVRIGLSQLEAHSASTALDTARKAADQVSLIKVLSHQAI